MTAPAPLRSDLTIRKIAKQGDVTYVVKDPDSLSYYRFDEAQYLMLTLFDGKRTEAQLLEAFDVASDDYVYDQDSLNYLIGSAKDFKLLERTREEEQTALFEKLRERRKRSLLQAQGSLLMMRFKLVNPKAFFDLILDKVRFIWTPWGVRFSMVIIAFAVYVAISQGARFLNDFEQVFFFSKQGGLNFLYIWCVALGAIAFHEIGHGLTCRNFGGDVDEMGFLLLAFQPCFYCNVNDAWLFKDNRQKIYVALAGVWFELVLSAFGVFIWSMTDIETFIGRISFILVTVATASSLFLNLNPLMKFDGYYILSDWLEMANLRQNSIDWFSFILKTRVFRLKVDQPLHPTPKERRVYFTYGMLAVVYLTASLSGLAFLGYKLVGEAWGTVGILVFLFLVAKLVKMMTGSWLSTIKEWLVMVFISSKPRRIVSVTLATGLVLLLIFWAPPVVIMSKGKVSAESIPVNAPETGFVTVVNVNRDRTLPPEAAKSLFVMKSPNLELEIVQSQSQMNSLALDRNAAINKRDMAGLRHFEIKNQAAVEKLAGAKSRQNSLNIPAPPGQWEVDGPPPETLKGRYFSRGDVVVTLIPAKERRFDCVLEQSDLSNIGVGDWARIKLTGAADRIYTGSVRQITPVSKLDGPTRQFQVRIAVHLSDKDNTALPLDLTGDAMILGQHLPLWQHMQRFIRNTLRTDLWI
ncbi:MAG: HlyD family efflux transporter periplasmic adaptor subunit [Magnetococcales bacterium]|nr:HlyD family efflux transporter periplasmic adaptor subunit [Magnetococcales bacterium]